MVEVLAIVVALALVAISLEAFVALVFWVGNFFQKRS